MGCAKRGHAPSRQDHAGLWADTRSKRRAEGCELRWTPVQTACAQKGSSPTQEKLPAATSSAETETHTEAHAAAHAEAQALDATGDTANDLRTTQTISFREDRPHKPRS